MMEGQLRVLTLLIAATVVALLIGCGGGEQAGPSAELPELSLEERGLKARDLAGIPGLESVSSLPAELADAVRYNADSGEWAPPGVRDALVQVYTGQAPEIPGFRFGVLEFRSDEGAASYMEHRRGNSTPALTQLADLPGGYVGGDGSNLVSVVFSGQQFVYYLAQIGENYEDEIDSAPLEAAGRNWHGRVSGVAGADPAPSGDGGEGGQQALPADEPVSQSRDARRGCPITLLEAESALGADLEDFLPRTTDPSILCAYRSRVLDPNYFDRSLPHVELQVNAVQTFGDVDAYRNSASGSIVVERQEWGDGAFLVHGGVGIFQAVLPAGSDVWVLTASGDGAEDQATAENMASKLVEALE